ncbi:MAG: glyceraldehyde-3-phosphate dehydrogenase [Saprospiraceae bacterium]|jgi:glyceraldehyde 3-phosphate dehydrogenase|nr:glyceraldehyde-3-phosphate dehydrogenase [Saprospiraceae bacterium]
MPKEIYEKTLQTWIEDEKAALELIAVVGKLWFDHSIELVIFRNQMVDRSASELLNLHHYAREVVRHPLSVHDTLALAKAIYANHLAPSRLDIGRIGVEWLDEKAAYANESDFIAKKLKDFIGEDKIHLKPKDVVLYGFGRIGRIAARELITQAGKGEQLRLRAIVTRDKSPDDIIKRADLLRSDSVHGHFPGTVIADVENKCIWVNGHKVDMISAGTPEEIDYTAYGIEDALLIDNTGVWRDRANLSRHLQSKGVSKVLLTAPGKGDIPNIVHGVNNHNADIQGEDIWSAASCTTNAIVPVLSVIHKALSIDKGHIETVHSYTNDQNLLDNYHKKYRRGRSAALNLVITETGAESAISKVMPELSGKFTGNAIRVPTPNVSLAVLNLQVHNATDKDSVNEIMRQAALKGNLVEQIQYSFSNELVSSDLVGNSTSSIFDSPATIVSKDGKGIVLYVWYDNEYGYTRQVIRFAKQLAGVIRLRYY